MFYKVDERATISGTVTEFRFSNPHAILKFEVVAADGEKQEWTAETTSPSILRRRGWSQASFEPGEKVKLEGMPSLDGSYLDAHHARVARRRDRDRRAAGNQQLTCAR